MHRAFVILGSLALVVAALGAFWACLEITPIVVERDAFTPDAACTKCVEEPENCRDVIAACKDDPRCAPAYACILKDGCLDLRTLDDKIRCGLPCAQEAGIESPSDPVISTHLVGLVGCAQQKCAEPCNLVDASISF
jgi:hypothetical protein